MLQSHALTCFIIIQYIRDRNTKVYIVYSHKKNPKNHWNSFGVLIFHIDAQQNYFTSNIYKRYAHKNDFIKYKTLDIHSEKNHILGYKYSFSVLHPHNNGINIISLKV